MSETLKAVNISTSLEAFSKAENISQTQTIQADQTASFAGEVQIRNRKGLHARASAMFVKCASTFEAEIFVSRCGETVGGTSIMGLMMLAASQGTKIHIEAKGPEAEQAFQSLTELVEAGFHEED